MLRSYCLASCMKYVLNAICLCFSVPCCLVRMLCKKQILQPRALWEKYSTWWTRMTTGTLPTIRSCFPLNSPCTMQSTYFRCYKVCNMHMAYVKFTVMGIKYWPSVKPFALKSERLKIQVVPLLYQFYSPVQSCNTYTIELNAYNRIHTMKTISPCQQRLGKTISSSRVNHVSPHVGPALVVT